MLDKRLENGGERQGKHGIFFWKGRRRGRRRREGKKEEGRREGGMKVGGRREEEK